MLLENLAKQSGVSNAKLELIARTASRRYKVYDIPKRSGGLRTIEHPSRELKAIQRWIVKTVFNKLPVHNCATAYKKGASVRTNASRHQHTNYTTRFDFIGFFPSFHQNRLELFLTRQNEHLGFNLSKHDIDFIGSLVCRYGRLTIGAPSSPAISNAMMYSFDKSLSDYCEERNIIYTRYADDLFFSSVEKNAMGGIEDEIRRANHGIDYLALRINQRKTAYLSRKYGRRITGIFITPDHDVSIGRHRKREIKSLIHKWINNELPLSRLGYLRGLLAFSCDVEPDLEDRLRRKYGAEPIDRVLHDPTLVKFEIEEDV